MTEQLGKLLQPLSCFPSFSPTICTGQTSLWLWISNRTILTCLYWFRCRPRLGTESLVANASRTLLGIVALTIINLARSIINRPRGSPTAKNKVLKLQKIAREEPRLGENDFMNSFIRALRIEARMVPNAPVTCTQALTVADFKADPRAWKEDFLGE